MREVDVLSSDERQTNIFKLRLSRRTYWFSVGGLVAALLLLTTLVPEFSGSGMLAVWIMLYAWRLHDFGRSGWWAVLVAVALAAIALLGVIIEPEGMTYLFGDSSEEPSSSELILAGVIGFGVILLQLGFTIWLGLQPGDPGKNRYGWPDGKRPRAQTIFDAPQG